MIEFLCEECKEGRVRWQTRANYSTKVHGHPFVVPEAVVGVCDHCGAEAFDPQESRRWARLYDESLEKQGFLLTAEEISDIRGQLGLSIGNFALLVGCTRQTVYNWERCDRKSPQLKLADLLLKLVRESMYSGEVDVLRYLLFQAEQGGIALSMSRNPMAPRRMIARAREISCAPHEAFDRLFNEHCEPRELPALVPQYME